MSLLIEYMQPWMLCIDEIEEKIQSLNTSKNHSESISERFRIQDPPLRLKKFQKNYPTTMVRQISLLIEYMQSCMLDTDEILKEVKSVDITFCFHG